MQGVYSASDNLHTLYAISRHSVHGLDKEAEWGGAMGCNCDERCCRRSRRRNFKTFVAMNEQAVWSALNICRVSLDSYLFIGHAAHIQWQWERPYSVSPHSWTCRKHSGETNRHLGAKIPPTRRIILPGIFEENFLVVNSRSYFEQDSETTLIQK